MKRVHHNQKIDKKESYKKKSSAHILFTWYKDKIKKESSLIRSF